MSVCRTKVTGLQKNELSCQARLTRSCFVNNLEFHQDLEKKKTLEAGGKMWKKAQKLKILRYI